MPSSFCSCIDNAGEFWWKENSLSSLNGLLIGGAVPALAFGVGALFQKQSNDIGIGQTYYLLFFSLGLLASATLAYFIFADNKFSIPAGGFAAVHGLLFGIGFVALAMGLTLYQQPISKLVPLVNMSTLVTVVLGLIVFAEHEKLEVGNLLIGAGFIVFGGILVSRA